MLFLIKSEKKSRRWRHAAFISQSIMFTRRRHTKINRSMMMSQVIYQIRQVHHGGWVRGLLTLTHSQVHLCTPALSMTMSYTGGLTSSVKALMFQSIYSITPPLATLLRRIIRFWHQWKYTYGIQSRMRFAQMLVS